MSEAGFRIELDDFGTGHTAISSVINFPVFQIKIDRSLVTNVANDSRLQAVVHAVLELGEKLGVEVLAEGIESALELEYLAAANCHLGQGYHLGKPMSLDAVGAWIDAWRQRATGPWDNMLTGKIATPEAFKRALGS